MANELDDLSVRPPDGTDGGGFLFGARNTGGSGTGTNYFLNVWAGASEKELSK